MQVTLPLNEMSLAEKLQVMESIWDDISRDPNSLESPDWHNSTLAEREKRVAEGKSQFIDWEQAKKDIRRRTTQ